MARSSRASVKTSTCFAPALKGALPLTKNIRPIRPAADATDDLESRRGKRDLVRAMVLGPLGRNAPACRREVDLLPSHAAHLLPALAREDEELHDPAVVVSPT